jgi:hypothetical protein
MTIQLTLSSRNNLKLRFLYTNLRFVGLDGNSVAMLTGSPRSTPCHPRASYRVRVLRRGRYLYSESFIHRLTQFMIGLGFLLAYCALDRLFLFIELIDSRGWLRMSIHRKRCPMESSTRSPGPARSAVVSGVSHIPRCAMMQCSLIT